MKGHKIKIIVLIVAIVLILAILIIPFVRKVVILSTISNKISQLEENTDNVYKKIETHNKTAEAYILGDKRKDVLNGETVQVVLRKDKNIEYYTFPNPTDIDTPIFLQTKDKKIKTAELDGKKCYVIITANDALPQQENETPKESIEYYEKDTGLLIKRIDCVEVNGSRKEYLCTYKYEFDKVTEEDFTEPVGYKNFSSTIQK